MEWPEYVRIIQGFDPEDLSVAMLVTSSLRAAAAASIVHLWRRESTPGWAGMVLAAPDQPYW